jgi:hypothetical protein
LGSQTGISALIRFVALKTIDMSVNTNASQVMTPTVKSNLVIALVRIET